MTQLQVLRDMEPGDEMLTNYGNDWFEYRKIVKHTISMRGNTAAGSASDSPPLLQQAQAKAESLARAQQEGICLSDIHVADSLIEDAGKGVYARKAFSAGDLITVSPVALLPMDMVMESMSSSLLMNYCITLPGSVVALLPLSYPTIFNHQSPGPERGRREGANAMYRWFDWTTLNQSQTSRNSLYGVYSNRQSESPVSRLLRAPVEELLASPFGPLDLGYYALRDIEEGEELTIDYGEAWQTAWNDWLARRDTEDVMFRQSIQPPEGLFPDHWFSRK